MSVAAGLGMRQTRAMRDGDRMMLPCVGGPTVWRAAAFPPPQEIEFDDGVYVLVDDGPPEYWKYAFVVVQVGA